MNPDDQQQQIIEHKITKVNGETGYKRYIKGKFLGKGGFAKCYEGINTQTKKMYAIKVIEKSSLQKNRAKQKLLSQIKIHKTLHHRHVVQFDSVFEDNKNVYIILELCTCKTLSQMVKKRKRLTTKEARFFMLQLISGLEYMHGCRVIHRDLKMGNIFLSASMDMKIGDFGLATKLEYNEEKKRTMCGTPNYIAPEIVQGAVGHSYQVDVWSSGVICYALLYGRPPFQTNEVKTTYKKIKCCDYAFPSSSVSEEAKDFIKKILMLDPKQRLTLKEMLQHPFLQNEDVPKSLPIQALINIPTFKGSSSTDDDEFQKIRSIERLRPEDFGKQKLSININAGSQKQVSDIAFTGMYSPRQLLNQQGTDRAKDRSQSPSRNVDQNVSILAYVDYSTKYGLGYLAHNGTYGVYFNDSSVVSIDDSKTFVYYLDNATEKDSKQTCYRVDSLPNEKNFQKKYQLLERFIISLDEQVTKLQKEKAVITKSDKSPVEDDPHFIYMKQWLKTKHAIMFRLSNKLFQVNFFDNSQILLNTEKKTLLFTSKKGDKTQATLAEALNAKDTEMSRRIKYTKQILNSIKKGKDQKLDTIKIPKN